jgi:hypothetical protein
MHKLTRTLLFAALFIASGCGSGSHHRSSSVSDEALVSRWRDKQVTLSQMNDLDGSWKGYADWSRFRGRMKSGDEMWHFCSPKPMWAKLMGWEGYAIFRDGRLVDTFTLSEN